jgi:pyruvate kinase
MMDIICSIGPKVNNTIALSELYKAGMNVLRFNFSHADYEHTKKLMDYARENLQGAKIMADLQGPKQRVSGSFPEEIKVYPGQEVLFCSEATYVQYRKHAIKYIIVPIATDAPFSALMGAKSIFMKDATMKFRVIGRNDLFIKTVVERGGILRAEKGINAPGMNRRSLTLTEKDKKDLLWALDNNVDIIVLSFVSSKENIIEMNEFINHYKKYKSFHQPKLWAKIESREGVENFDPILELVDGIMLGRGDMFAEIPYYEIPAIQDSIMAKMRNTNKDLVIATYVLSSMRSNPLPLISELDDIYNCLQKGATGFMLSGEVSTGSYPQQVVETLSSMLQLYGNSR